MIVDSSKIFCSTHTIAGEKVWNSGCITVSNNISRLNSNSCKQYLLQTKSMVTHTNESNNVMRLYHYANCWTIFLEAWRNNNHSYLVATCQYSEVIISVRFDFCYNDCRYVNISIDLENTLFFLKYYLKLKCLQLFQV